MTTIGKIQGMPAQLPMEAYELGQTKILGKEFRDCVIKKLDQWDAKLDTILPNFFFQDKLDKIGSLIQETFKPLAEFSKWLDSNGLCCWHTQVATYLVKLPMRAVRNIVQLLYSIIKGLIYATVHPAKSLTAVARLITQLVFELTRPEVWSKLGAGIIGTSCGQALITGNPVSLLGVGIGAAFVFAGVTLGPLKAALEAENDKRKEAVIQHILYQAKQLPEAMLTGFCMGLIVGGIQRVITHYQTNVANAKVKAEVRQFLKENDLPEYTNWSLDPSTGKITIDVRYGLFGNWRVPQEVAEMSKLQGSLQPNELIALRELKMEILSHSTSATVRGYTYKIEDIRGYGTVEAPTGTIQFSIPAHTFKSMPEAYVLSRADLHPVGQTLGTAAVVQKFTKSLSEGAQFAPVGAIGTFSAKSKQGKDLSFTP